MFNSLFIGISYLFSGYASKGDASFVDSDAVNSSGLTYAAGAAAAAAAAWFETIAMAIMYKAAVSLESPLALA